MKKTKAIWLSITLVTAATALTHEVLQAQGHPEGPATETHEHRDLDRQGHGPGPGHRPPPPVIVALDVNRDGMIDASELANAASSLKQLDANNDGSLTIEELRPPRPQRGPGGQCSHPHGPRPDHRPDQQ